jgi:hypothetical protein
MRRICDKYRHCRHRTRRHRTPYGRGGKRIVTVSNSKQHICVINYSIFCIELNAISQSVSSHTYL